MRYSFPVASFFCLMVVSTPEIAQEATIPTISTDRPSVGSGPDLVPVTWTVVENGIGIKASSGSVDVDGSETLIRYGLWKRLELRLSPTNLLRSGSSSTFFRQDGSITIKTPVPSIKAWPVAFVGGYTIPVGSYGQSSGSWDPTLLLTTAHSLGSRVTTGATWNRYWTSSPGSQRIHSDQVAFDLGWNTSTTTSAFAEWAPLYNSNPTLAGYTADAGVTWVRHSLQQWDARVGYSRTGSSGAMIAGIGYSFMLPRRVFFSH